MPRTRRPRHAKPEQHPEDRPPMSSWWMFTIAALVAAALIGMALLINH